MKHMEAPCICDCGNMFDLFDGNRSEKSNSVICKSCHAKNVTINKKIENLEIDLFDLEASDRKPATQKRIRRMIEELRDSLL